MAKIKILILILLLIALGSSFLFKNQLADFYNDLRGNIENQLQNLKDGELGNRLNEIKREVITFSPLFVGGQETNVVLTKEKIIAQTNIQRFNNGDLSLTENQLLNNAALVKAQDMFAKQYFEHVSPTGVDPGNLVKNAGYEYILTGENLIMGNFESEKELVQLWMESPGHRENILNERFTEIGVAIIKGVYNGQTVWIGVQEFGFPLSACSAVSEQLKVEIEFNKNQLAQLDLQVEAKKEEINHTNKRSPRYNQLVQEHNELAAAYNLLSEETKLLVLEYNSQVESFNLCASQ